MMSRHEQIPGLNPDHACVVGYDRGLKSFFGQVFSISRRFAAAEANQRLDEAEAQGLPVDLSDELAAEDDGLVQWVGADRPEAIPTVEELVRHLEPYVTLSAELVETLRREQEQAESRPRTAHQNQMLELIAHHSPRRS